MGLCLCKRSKRDGRKVPESLYALSTSMDSSVKVYSWDRRPLESIEQCSCNGLVDSIKVFMPESVAGQQFTIENCQGCKIFMLDRTASIIIDDCQDCQIVLGPCSGSVFIRNSLDCRLWLLCQQFRMRDCRKLQVNLFCQSSPSLESSRSIEFTCVQIFYCQLDAQLCAAGLKTLNNHWSYVHDFSADEASNANFLCSCEIRVPILNDDDDMQPLKQLKLSFDPLNSLIPLTVPWNHRFSLSQVSFLSLLLSKDPAVNLANSVSLSKALAASHITMIRTGEFSVSARMVDLLFADKAKNCDQLTDTPLAVFVTPNAQSRRIREAVESLDVASQWCMTNGECCPQIFEKFYRAYSS